MDIMEKLRERVTKHYMGQRNSYTECVDAIMADVEIALVLARREGFEAGARWMNGGTIPHVNPVVHRTAERYPLPTRTRRVLREEPDPYNSCHWRVVDGKVQYTAWRFNEWQWIDDDGEHGSIVTPERAVLWADLYANPYREETVEVDPDNPWGEP